MPRSDNMKYTHFVCPRGVHRRGWTSWIARALIRNPAECTQRARISHTRRGVTYTGVAGHVQRANKASPSENYCPILSYVVDHVARRETPFDDGKPCCAREANGTKTSCPGARARVLSWSLEELKIDVLPSRWFTIGFRGNSTRSQLQRVVHGVWCLIAAPFSTVISGRPGSLTNVNGQPSTNNV